MNSTAEKKNIPWREMTKEILDSDVYKLMDEIQDPSLVYPDCNVSLTSLLLVLNEIWCNNAYSVPFIGLWPSGYPLLLVTKTLMV